MFRALGHAIRFFSVFPFPGPSDFRGRDFGSLMACAPLAGIVVALPLTVLTYACTAYAVGCDLAALLVLAAWLFLTRMLHLDGLLDCADAFWGGHNRARRLEIMKDCRIGTFALGVGFVFLTAKHLAIRAFLSWPGLANVSSRRALAAFALFFWALPAARCSIVAITRSLAYARPGDGLGKFAFTRVGGGHALVSFVLAFAVPLGGLLVGCENPDYAAFFVGAFALALGSSLVIALFARKALGGGTGDVLGAGIEIAELCWIGGITVALRVL